LGCTHAGTAIARSLGKRGIYTIGLTYNLNQFGLASRYLDEWHLCPHPEDGEVFIDFLLENKAKWGGSVLLETNDYFAAALSKHKARLLPHYKVVSADWEHVKLFLKKDMTYALADVCDVPHPQIYEPTTLVEFDAMADRFVFPLMIKPVLSHEFTKLFHTKLFINDTLDLLRANFQGCLEAHQAVMISEIIPGTDYGTVERIHVYINSKGEVSAEFFTVKLLPCTESCGLAKVFHPLMIFGSIAFAFSLTYTTVDMQISSLSETLVTAS
jgi:predicted ATP-grasp superfamily ATP-dependent carboligase